MDARVARLEEMGEVRAILRRIEPMIVRSDAQFPYLAAKAEAERLRRDLSTDLATPRRDVSTGISVGIVYLPYIAAKQQRLK